MTRVWIMAEATFREAARKKILWMALAAGCGFLVLFVFAMRFQAASLKDSHLPPLLRKEALNTIVMLGMYAVDLLVVVLTVLTSVDTLSGEIDSGVIQAIATKPVRRVELLAGKWLGFAGMLTLYILLMFGGVNAVAYATTGVVVRHFARGLGLIWLESALLLSMTLFFGTWLSTITNGVLVLGLHGLAFIGGGVEQAGALTHTPKAVALGVIASIVMPSESLWRRAAFEMQSPLVSAVGLSPFSAASVPSVAMIAYAVLYTLVFWLLAVRVLNRRDL